MTYDTHPDQYVPGCTCDACSMMNSFGPDKTDSEKLDEILARFNAVEEMVRGLIKELEPILEEALPAIKAVQESTFFRMIAKGTKK